jgi:phenylalanyl-tRNA synthetase beta subunit
LIFQDKSKTLTDRDADVLMAAVAVELGAKLDARVRN